MRVAYCTDLVHKIHFADMQVAVDGWVEAADIRFVEVMESLVSPLVLAEYCQVHHWCTIVHLH